MSGSIASGHMVTKPTTKEAEEYYHYLVYEMGDWEAGEHAAAIRTKGTRHAAQTIDHAHRKDDQRRWHLPGCREL